MKTKYILHGGYTREDNEHNNSFCAELVGDVPEGGTVLLVLFATAPEEVEEKFAGDCEQMRRFAGDKDVEFVLATEENFIEQVKTADVVYIRGGDTQKLKEMLAKYPEFTEAIKGKTVGGSSAGAYVLSRYYFTNSLQEVREGFGCVSARTICHYKSPRYPVAEGTDPVEMMSDYDNGLELIILPDYEWVVREVEE